MRPSRLQIKGFTAFRSQTEIDFTGTDLFALTGPTGSGKSSIIDAICFALYGSTPRLGGRQVEPVISLGAQEARILFDFEIDGRPYTVGRVVRRTKIGATTSEARLEGDDQAVSGADEVTRAVERLLGLGFDHFTRCVVLPQGEFAKFLHDPPSERQKLLRQLLDLAIYRRMAEEAKRRQATAEAEASVFDRQATQFAYATAQVEAAAEDRVGELSGLRAMLGEAEPGLARLEADRAEAEQRVRDAEQPLSHLAAISLPPGVNSVADRVRVASAANRTAEAEEKAAAVMAEAAEGEAARLPTVDSLDQVLDAWDRWAKLGEKRRQMEVVTAAARTGAERARTGAEAAREAAETAHDRLVTTETTHRAHAVAATLVTGDPCPVCLQPVLALPDRPPLADLAAASDQRTRADAAAAEARRAHDTAERDLDRLGAQLDNLAADLAVLDGRLSGHPGRDETQSRRGEAAAAAAAVETTRGQARLAHQQIELSRREVDDSRAAEQRARAEFAAIRDTVTALGAPPAGMEDLGTDWGNLAGWASARMVEIETAVRDDRARVVTAATELGELKRVLADRLRAADVDPGRSPLDAVTRAEIEAAFRLEKIRSDQKSAVESLRDARDRRLQADLSKTMASLLSAPKFEGWLMEEAMLALVEGANLLLADLSRQTYSLEVANRDFLIVDHRNADDRRSVRTLSGGETFLVSLALALALADQIALVAAAGAVRLESLFLDEGFGALDSETLETAAAVIHELGAGGRSVGIVTHVKELADQVPVRFEVEARPGGSVVRRVET